MFVYRLELAPSYLEELSKRPEEIYDNLADKIPKNLDRRIFNNTIYFYFEQISIMKDITKEQANAIRFQYMRYHQAPLYGDMDEFIFIPTFEGGKRSATRGLFIQPVPITRNDKERR